MAVPGSCRGNRNVDWIEIVVKLGPESNNTDVDIAPIDSLDVVAVPEQTSDQKKLDKALVSGVAWTAGVKWISQILTWGMTLLVARLLQPVLSYNPTR
jgi:hypothetical protein